MLLCLILPCFGTHHPELLDYRTARISDLSGSSWQGTYLFPKPDVVCILGVYTDMILLRTRLIRLYILKYLLQVCMISNPGRKPHLISEAHCSL